MSAIKNTILQKPSKKKLTVFAHVAVWSCFFMLPYIFSPQPKDIPDNVNKYMISLFIVINLLLLGFYYFNTLILIPKFLFKKKWLIYFSIVAVCFTLFIYLPKEITNAINGTNEQILRAEMKQDFKQKRNNILADSSIEKKAITKLSNRQPRNNALRYFPGSFVVFLLVFSIGVCVSVMQQWFLEQRNKEKVEHEKINTELSFLKSQVNPHFFFNTLNNIYSLAVVQSDKTAPAIMKLSHIMRYILTETQTDRVPLENEITFIKNFIDLQLVRLTDKVKVHFLIEGDTFNKQIAPLLFIPFVENAFKYGVSTKENSEIIITLNVTQDKVVLNVTNTIVAIDKSLQDTTGIGIANVQRRLALLYPDKHIVEVGKENNLFKAHLEIFVP